MLYGQSKQYLLEKLTESGLKSRPYTALKALQKSQESHVGAVLFERDTSLLLTYGEQLPSVFPLPQSTSGSSYSRLRPCGRPGY